MEAVSNYCAELHIFLSHHCGILEITTQLPPALKCQADHSEIQARLLQEGPNEKTFYEPCISSPAPSLQDHLGQAETETAKAAS